MIEIRPFTDNDFDDFYAIRREALVSAPEAFLIKLEDFDRQAQEVARQRFLSSTAISNPDRLIVGAWVDDAAKGMAGLSRFNHTGFDHEMVIWGVFSSQTTRGLGLGQKMMTFLFDAATHIEGVSTLVLSVMADNKNAIQFYQKLGMEIFTPIENNPLLADAEEDEIFMVYHLTTT